MLEPAFLDAMEISRWEALVAVYCDVAVMAEGWLRLGVPERREHVDLVEFLTAEGTEFLGGFPVPAYRCDRGWEEDMAELRVRLSQAQLAAPKPPQEIARQSAHRIYETLPIHTNLRSFDLELVVNSVRFQFVRVNEDMQRQCDRDSMIQGLYPQSAA